MLALPEAIPATKGRTKALRCAGIMAHFEGKLSTARVLLEESATLCRVIGDQQELAYTLLGLGVTLRDLGDYPTAHTHYAEILAIHNSLAQHVPQMHSLQALTLSAYILGDVVAWSAHFVDDYATAVALFEEQVAVSRERGDEQLTAWLLNHLGDVVRAKGDNQRAAVLYQQSLALFQRMDLPTGVALTLHNLGYIHLQRGNVAEASAKFRKSLHLYLETAILWNQADCLVGLASVACAQGEWKQAAQLLGAAHAMHAASDVSGAFASPTIRREEARITAATRQHLSVQTWTTA